MSLQNLEGRVEKLEKIRGVDKPPGVLTIHFINSGGGEEPLTAEETAALEAHRERLVAESTETRMFPLILWTRKEAQKLINKQAVQEAIEGESKR